MALQYSSNTIKSCSLSQYDSIFYIFEIQIRNDEKITIRRIKNCKEGRLIDINDTIDTNINRIKFTIFDFNEPNNQIIIKKRFNKIINDIVILTSDNLILYLACQDNYVICNYKFI